MSMFTEQEYDKVYDEVMDYLGNNLDEAVDIAHELNYEWAYVYYSLDNLLEEYFCNEVADIINAFRNSDIEAYNYDEYAVVDDEIVLASDLEWTAEDKLDDIVDDLLANVQRGKSISMSDNLHKIIYERGITFEQFFETCVTSYPQITVEAKRYENGDISYDELMECLDIIYLSQRVIEYLKKTKFCGLPKEKYEEIRDKFSYMKDNGEVCCWLPCNLAESYYEDNPFGSKVSIEKFVDIHMSKLSASI